MLCRSCGQITHSIIPLGLLPLANDLLPSNHVKEGSTHKARHEVTYNLEVMLCPSCKLAQLKDIVDPKTLFSNYVYFSSNSQTMLNYAAALANRVIPSLSKDALVVEIASNDGYLLKNYLMKEVAVLGIDPAKNIAQYANAQGIPTLCEFFNFALAQKLKDEGKTADIIHANNVMAHVPDINDFIDGLKILLKPQGVCIIEVPHFSDLVEKLEFDTIYHEHVYYFTVNALKTCFERVNLEIFNIEKIPIHGGTLRLFVGHQGAHRIENIVDLLANEEMQSGLFDFTRYDRFMDNIYKLKEELQQTLQLFKNQGKKIAAYGASAKGSTLLNFFGIGAEHLDFVVDKSPVKQGCLTPGTKLKIKAPDALIKEKVDYALLLVWNFAEEIIAEQKAFTDQNGKFIIPLPCVKIVS